ncbi:uncharacterized protein TRIADDRAFT_54987 [Trichoplax adhaerens]|uniref:Transmembrane protein 177 n=1 Tax=Trichoplax adhaerens TaxID=10228 RepID=B3RQH2_TRIAD|nr:predicted protein [Trichoplax adhaerens]EDV27241.1 predicted protein [Trichoplax adhaerens]|eukprot:XP_002111237.1 predicted protein [Trichoplax adhaerens]
MKKVIVLGAVTCGILTLEFGPHFFHQSVVSNFMLNTKPVQQETFDLCQSICRKLGINKSNKIEVVVGEGFAAGNLGSTSLRNGAVLSLPYTMYFATRNDIERSGIIKSSYLSRHPDLADKLIPSPNCNKFQMAHELVRLKYKDFILSGTILPAFYLLGYGGFALCNKWALQRRLRILNKILVAVGTLSFYHIVTSRVMNWQVYRADRVAATIDPTYMAGGIEFMRKNQLWEKAFLNGAMPEASIMMLMGYLWHPPSGERLKRLLDLKNFTPYCDDID